MYVKRNIGWGVILRYGWKNLIFFSIYASLIFFVNHLPGWDFINIPFQPLSLMVLRLHFILDSRTPKAMIVFGKVEKFGVAL